ncbi:MAG: type II toxin-antitoxin system prevent-host-death family antitoxin [Kiritimatiellae bacterium]|nr:type II toxin-antitoxin system prevent-host-death family antitoxin [Kiritimatiellia bacterium]
MKKMNVFSVRELRNHSARFMKGAENGQISIITKRGKPTVMAVPFGEQALKELRSVGYRLSDSLCEELVRLAGESPKK